MLIKISIPTAREPLEFHLSAGETAIFVGANGGGKTRLAVHLEDLLGASGHRISAHRALTMKTDVPKISEENALQGLRVGNPEKTFQGRFELRSQFRYGKGTAAVGLLNDFDFLLQALFAQQANHVLKVRSEILAGKQNADAIKSLTKFDALRQIWERLLPHRTLKVSGDDIEVSIPESDEKYSASQMSDGERAIFYMIGQALVAANNQVIIVDEPELHVHPSIMSKLWDEIEGARPDCAFVFITHDLAFAAARAAQKYVIRGYSPTPSWDVEAVPEDTEFGGELTTLILGSRKPVLFVEGSHESLDFAIYRACYPDWTVVPRSSCTEVIHSVVTMRTNAELTRVACSSVVDGDDYEEKDREHLKKLGIEVLPVAEIENLLLLPDVSSAIASAEGFSGEAHAQKLSELTRAVFQSLDTDKKIEAVVVRYCQRRIDRTLKKIDLSSSKTIEELQNEYRDRTGNLDIKDIATARTKDIQQAVADRDLVKLLRLYDNKELLAIAATHLKGCKKERFEGWVNRCLRNDIHPELSRALQKNLPQVEPGEPQVR